MAATLACDVQLVVVRARASACSYFTSSSSLRKESTSFSTLLTLLSTFSIDLLKLLTSVMTASTFSARANPCGANRLRQLFHCDRVAHLVEVQIMVVGVVGGRPSGASRTTTQVDGLARLSLLLILSFSWQGMPGHTTKL